MGSGSPAAVRLGPQRLDFLRDFYREVVDEWVRVGLEWAAVG
jgi:hypothetical protein